MQAATGQVIVASCRRHKCPLPREGRESGSREERQVGGGLLPYSFGTFINMQCFHNVFVIVPNFSKMADNTISSTVDLYSE